MFANLSALTLYFLCAIAAYVLRKRDVRTDGEPFLAPGGPLVPVAACLSMAWLFYETVTLEQFLWLVGVLFLIVVLYAARALRSRKSAPSAA